jgi:hypothetical protein
MPVTELVDYIRTQTQEGVPAEDLRVALMDAGWQEFDIENALHDVAAGLHPATPGASIHEDLAQVRGMVAHLATRVKGIEVQLASLPLPHPLPVQAQLPSAFIGPDHELSVRGKGRALKALSLVIAVVISVYVGIFATGLVQRNALAPRDHLLIAAALGLIFIIAAIVSMRRGNGWIASLWTAFGLALWATDAYISWRIYHYLERSVALALGILFLVIALVMGRWIQRLSR